MTWKFPIFIILTIVLAAFSACNTSSDDTDSVTYTNTAITAFSINTSSSILDNMDSVFFSIDLANARIYNADSMPYGTDISRIVVTLTSSSCSVVEITVPREGQEDTVYNYLTSSTDSIDFSMGRATIHVVSYDGTASRDYDLRINVHQIEPDSLYWSQLACRSLPSLFDQPEKQKTVQYKGNMLCLTSAGNRYSVVTAANPGEDPSAGGWETTEIYPTFTPNIESLAATNEALYILDTDGNLYNSTDNGATWASCNGTKWHSIIGGYEAELLGVEKIGDDYYTVSYPAGTKTIADADFPISGSSLPVEFTTVWETTPQIMILGGRTASDNLTGDVWGYDGSSWAKISSTACPAMEGMAMAPYFAFRTNTDNWELTELTTWIAFGGVDEDGTPNSTVYLSLDQGIHWKVADDLMQLPEYIPAMSGCQALIFPTVMEARSSSRIWQEYAPKSLPRWWSIARTDNISRATAPITSWECPYIYLFGGYDENGKLYNTLWRGVINRLTFKPLQ